MGTMSREKRLQTFIDDLHSPGTAWVAYQEPPKKKVISAKIVTSPAIAEPEIAPQAELTVEPEPAVDEMWLALQEEYGVDPRVALGELAINPRENGL